MHASLDPSEFTRSPWALQCQSRSPTSSPQPGPTCSRIRPTSLVLQEFDDHMASFLIKECGHYCYPSPKVFWANALPEYLSYYRAILVAVIVATVAANIYLALTTGQTLFSTLCTWSGEWKSWLKAQHSKHKDHGIGSHCFTANRWGKSGNSDRLFSWAPKITVDSACSHEIKRCLILGRKVMTNLDSLLKSWDITLLTKVCVVKVMVFPVVLDGYESWTVKKAEHQRIDAFEL